MALVADLETSFGDGGFDLSVTVSGLATDLDAIEVTGATFDIDAVEALVDGLAIGDLEGIASAVAAAAGELGAAAELVPDLDALLGPLRPALDVIRLAGTDLATLGTRLGAVDAARTESGIDVLLPAIAAGASLTTDPTVRALGDLLSGTVGLDLAASAGELTGPLTGVAALVHLVGGLMAIESLTKDISVGVEVTASFLPGGRVLADLDRLLAWVDTGALVDLLVGIDPDDVGIVDLVTGPILDYTTTVRRVADAIVTGLAFGDATLAGLDVPALAARLDEATALVQRADVGAVRSLLADVRAHLDILVSVELPGPVALDEFVDGLGSAVARLAAGIDGFDPASLTEPVGDALRTVTAPLETVQEAAHEVVAGAQAALAAVRQVVTAVDLRPVTDAIATITAPLVTALDALEELIGDAQVAVDAAAGAVGDVITPVQDALAAAADAIRVAFTAVRDAVDALGLDAIGPELRAGAETVAAAVAAAQLKPVFDVVVGALDVAADALALTPRDLLPDDVRQALDDACGQLQAVDLEPVRETLRAELNAMVAEIDVSALDVVRQAQQAVVAFLDTIDPRPPLQELEDGPFADLIARLREADPSTPLAPVIEAVDETRNVVAGFDPGALLDPLDEAVQSVADAVAAFDPAALLAPVDQQVTAARLAAAEALQLDRWDRLVDDLTVALDRLLLRFDPVAMIEALDGAQDALVAEARRPVTGPSPLGTVITALVEGTGLRVRADAFAVVRGWLTGATAPSAAVVERLAAATSVIEQLAGTVEAIDLRGVVGRLDAHHARLMSALAVHAESSLLRVRLDAEVTAATPGPLLGTVLVNRDRYLAGLQEAVTALRRLSAASRSELDEAGRALRDAATPILEVVARVRTMLHATTGVSVDGRPLRDVLIELLERVRPTVLLMPLGLSLAALRNRTRDALAGALLQPIRDALDAVRGTIDALDISFVRIELTAARDDVISTVEGLRPSTLLGPLLTEVEDLRDRVAAFDPLGPVRAVVEGLRLTIDQLERDFAPTAVAGPALEAYDIVRDAVAAVDVDEVLQPVLDALDGVADQLESGMDRLIDALHGVQDACASGGPSLGAALGAAAGLAGALAGGSVSVDVSVGGGIGL